MGSGNSVAARPAGALKEPIGTLAGLRILLAEDESLIGFHLKRILEDFGCEAVGPFGSLDEVLDNALHARFDGALLDVNLRSRQIFEILPALQKVGLQIILASGYDDATLFPPAYRAIPRVAKPFSERELLTICERTFVRASGGGKGSSELGEPRLKRSARRASPHARPHVLPPEM
ncbi:MAG: response regulator [Methylocystis sp.]